MTILLDLKIHFQVKSFISSDRRMPLLAENVQAFTHGNHKLHGSQAVQFKFLFFSFFESKGILLNNSRLVGFAV